MQLRVFFSIAALVLAGTVPAFADIPGAYGMWSDMPKRSKSNAGLFSSPQGLPPLNGGLKSKAFLQGGGKPAVFPRAPAVVAFKGYEKGSVVVVQSKKKLYYVLGEGKAFMYPVAVGKQGFKWTGTEQVSKVVAWPDWVPPAEMRQRKPELPVKMAGGINNPLGAKAIYLGSSLYRIHGTNDASSIGTAASSGCIRMHNGDVVHLASLVSVGTTVHVVR